MNVQKNYKKKSLLAFHNPPEACIFLNLNILSNPVRGKEVFSSQAKRQGRHSLLFSCPRFKACFFLILFIWWIIVEYCEAHRAGALDFVSLGKLLVLSTPWLIHLSDGDNSTIYISELLWVVLKIMCKMGHYTLCTKGMSLLPATILIIIFPFTPEGPYSSP